MMAFSDCYGWVIENYMCEITKPMLKNQYNQYLLKVIERIKV